MEMLQISILAHGDKQNELFRTCRLISDQSLRASGCKISRVSQDSDNVNIITLEQQWQQWSSLNNFFRSEHFSALVGAMKLLGRTYEIRINGVVQEERGDKVIQNKS